VWLLNSSEPAWPPLGGLFLLAASEPRSVGLVALTDEDDCSMFLQSDVKVFVQAPGFRPRGFLLLGCMQGIQ
jgi:hypothetical protein